MKEHFYLIVLPLLLAACNKVSTEPHSGETFTTNVSGYVLTTDSLDPIPNIRLRITPLQGGISANGGAVITDTSGYYSFTYTGPTSGEVGIGFGGNGTYSSYGGFDYITPFLNATHDLEIQPNGWLQLHVKNINVQSPNDGFAVDAGGNIEILYGITDNIINWKIPGNGNIIINWTVNKNNDSKQYADTLYCPGFDTTFYEILY